MSDGQSSVIGVYLKNGGGLVSCKSSLSIYLKVDELKGAVHFMNTLLRRCRATLCYMAIYSPHSMSYTLCYEVLFVSQCGYCGVYNDSIYTLLTEDAKKHKGRTKNSTM